MRDFEEFGFKVGLYSARYKHPFAIPIQDGGSARLKTSGSDRSWKWTVLTRQRRTDLETNAPEVWHMSRLEFVCVGLPNPISKSAFSNVCGIPFTQQHLCAFANRQ